MRTSVWAAAAFAGVAGVSAFAPTPAALSHLSRPAISASAPALRPARVAAGEDPIATPSGSLLRLVLHLSRGVWEACGGASDP